MNKRLGNHKAGVELCHAQRCNQLTKNRHFHLRYTGLEITNGGWDTLNLADIGLSCHWPQMVIKAIMIRCLSPSRAAAGGRQLGAVPLLWLKTPRRLHTCHTHRSTLQAGSVAHAVIHNMWPCMSSTFVSSEEGSSSVNTSATRKRDASLESLFPPPQMMIITQQNFVMKLHIRFTFNPDAYLQPWGLCTDPLW